jgi:hypothetical protein
MAMRRPSCSRSAKVCPVCGRSFHWHKKWERDWDQVRYCSHACCQRKKQLRKQTEESDERTRYRVAVERRNGVG